MLILIKGCILLLKTCYDERSDFPVEVQDTLSYQHDLCMKKTRAFNVWGLKTSYEKQSEESNRWETMNTWRWRLYIEKALKKQDTNYLPEYFFYFFL